MRCFALSLLAISCGACASTPSVPARQGDDSAAGLAGLLVHSLGSGLDGFEGGSGDAGGMDIQIGSRSLPERAFGRARHHLVYGLQFVLPIEQSPLAVEFGASYSQGDSDYLGFRELEGLLIEGSAGLRLTMGSGDLQPYVGAGFTGIYASLEDAAQDSLNGDIGGGTYIHAGLAFQIAGGKFVGLDWRRVQNVELDSFEGTGNTLYNQLTLVIGVNF